MEPIPQEVVDQVWDEVVSTDAEAAEDEFHRVLETQPALASYLLALDEELLPPDEQGSLMMIGYCVLRVMGRGGRELREIEPEEIEAAEAENFAMLETLGEGSECDLMEAVNKLMQTYPQAALLGTVLEALMEGDEVTPEDAPENVGMLFLHMKSVIDCLDR